MAHNCIEICSRIQRIREQQRIKQEEIADFLGITASAYSKIENGHSTLTMVTACKIANFLGIELAELVQEEKEIERIETKTEDKETEFYEEGIAFFKEALKWLKK